MKKNIVIAALFAFIGIVNISAQNTARAVQILDNIIGLSKTNAVKTGFVLSSKSNGANSLVMNGTFLMKGNKFVLKSNQMDVYFDGKTQWAYQKKVNEIDITNPTEKELSQTNPMAILSTFKNKSTVSLVKSSGSTNIIQLIPKVGNSDIKKIIVTVNKSNNYPLSIQLTDKKGTVSTLSLSRFQTNVKVSDSAFVLNEKSYKDAEINDLR